MEGLKREWCLAHFAAVSFRDDSATVPVAFGVSHKAKEALARFTSTPPHVHPCTLETRVSPALPESPCAARCIRGP